jgi:hypothetical protein
LICAATQDLGSLQVSIPVNTQGTMLLSHVAATTDPPWTQMLQATNQDTQIIIIGHLINMYTLFTAGFELYFNAPGVINKMLIQLS